MDRLRDRRPVLLLDGESRASLAAARALNRAGWTVAALITGTGPHPLASSRHVASVHTVTPYTTDPARFQADVLAVTSSIRPCALLSSEDASVVTVLPLRAEIESLGARLGIAGADAVAMALDKSATLDAAGRLGVAIPKGGAVIDDADAERVAREYGFPVVVKPSASWLSGGTNWTPRARAARNPAELRELLGLATGPGGSALVQQWLPGRREQIHVLAHQGAVRAAVAVGVIRTEPALGGSAVLRETIPMPGDSLDLAERVIEATGLNGYAEVELRRDRGGRPVLMEANCRLSASVGLPIIAGVNFPDLLVRQLLGGALPDRLPAYRTGVRMRWLRGDLRWLRENIRTGPGIDLVSPRIAVLRFIRDWATPSAFDYLDPRDPMPVLAQLRRELRQR